MTLKRIIKDILVHLDHRRAILLLGGIRPRINKNILHDPLTRLPRYPPLALSYPSR